MPETNRTNQFAIWDRQETTIIPSYGGESRATLLTPENSVSDVPVLVAGGWSGGSRTLKGVGRIITGVGRPAVLFDHARFGRANDDEAYAGETVQKAWTMLNAMEQFGIERADVIAHSEGSLASIYAVLQFPEKFRSLVLVAPAGLVGEDSVGELLRRFSRRNLARDIKDNPRIVGNILLSGSAYIAKNPVKAAREVSVIANSRVDNLLRELKLEGVNIGLLQSHADPVFPHERIEESVEMNKPWRDRFVDAHASVVYKNAGHDDFVINPQRTARAAVQMLEDFESNPPVKTD